MARQLLTAGQDLSGSPRTENDMGSLLLPPECAEDFEMRFAPLSGRGRALAFPCDPSGQVDCDRLAPDVLRTYLYARAMIGREFGWPSVCRRER